MRERSRSDAGAPFDPDAPLQLPLPFTSHARARVRQRAYRERDVALIIQYGRPTQDGHLLLRKDVEQLRRELKRLLDRLDHLAGSAVFSGDDGSVLSVYRPAKAKRRRMTRGAA